MALIEARIHGTSTPARNWRNIAFPAIAGLLALGSLTFLDGVLEGAMPWLNLGIGELYPAYEGHRFQGALHGSMVGWLFAGSAIAAMRRPADKPLLVQFYALAHLAVMAIFSAFFFNPFFMVMFLVTTGLFVGLYPKPRALLSLKPVGRTSLPLLGLTLAAAALHLPGVADAISRQLPYLGQSPEFAPYYLGGVVTPALLVLAGLLAATRRPGFRPLAILTGLTYGYLGLAAITVPGDIFSWGVVGGGLAVLGGVAYIAAALRDRPTGATNDQAA